MNRDTARDLLNAARAGADIDPERITAALVATGDLRPEPHAATLETLETPTVKLTLDDKVRVRLNTSGWRLCPVHTAPPPDADGWIAWPIRELLTRFGPLLAAGAAPFEGDTLELALEERRSDLSEVGAQMRVALEDLVMPVAASRRETAHTLLTTFVEVALRAMARLHPDEVRYCAQVAELDLRLPPGSAS